MHRKEEKKKGHTYRLLRAINLDHPPALLHHAGNVAESLPLMVRFASMRRCAFDIEFDRERLDHFRRDPPGVTRLDQCIFQACDGLGDACVQFGEVVRVDLAVAIPRRSIVGDVGVAVLG